MLLLQVERDIKEGGAGVVVGYMRARYYDGSLGRFRSIDPVYLAVGTPQLKEKTQQTLELYLSDPQLLNSYSYVRNNPLNHVDDNGEYLESMVDIGFMAYDTYKIAQALARGESIKPHVQVLALDAAGLALPGVTGLGMMGRIAGKVDNIPDVFRGIDNAKDILKDSGKIADKIANGHGYTKHIDNLKGGDFGSIIKTQEQYSSYIKSVIENPSEVRQLSGGRTAFYDNRLGGIVVHNPKSIDAGTAFRPDSKIHGYKTNRDYFRKGLR